MQEVNRRLSELETQVRRLRAELNGYFGPVPLEQRRAQLATTLEVLGRGQSQLIDDVGRLDRTLGSIDEATSQIIALSEILVGLLRTHASKFAWQLNCSAGFAVQLRSLSETLSEEDQKSLPAAILRLLAHYVDAIGTEAVAETDGQEIMTFVRSSRSTSKSD
jgi:hypothetical protein